MVSADTQLVGGGVVVGGGRIRRLVQSRAAAARLARREGLPWTELDHGCLAPCLVNAHVHLELSYLGGEVPARGGFRAWVERLIAARAGERTAQGRRRRDLGLGRAADTILATGTGAVGDIDSSGAVQVLAPHPLRVTAFREVLDAGDEGRSDSAMERVGRALPRRVGLREGLSPHAPFTVSERTLLRLGQLARRRRLPVAIHWAETEEEERYLLTGEGPFAGFVSTTPGRSGLQRLEAAGLLGPGTALVHGNHPGRGELPRVARAGATVVHCPGSHHFFGRAPFPLAAYRRAGVRLALGTDSAASNAELDMRREMQLARETLPLSAAEVFRMATENAALAIGAGEELGTLHPGRRADLCWFELGSTADAAASRQGAAALDELTQARPPVHAMWLGGRRVLTPPGNRAVGQP